MGHLRIVFLTLVLAGCGLAQQAQIRQDADNAAAKRDAAFADCNLRHKDSEVKRIKCSNKADLEYHMALDRSVGHPGLDLVRLYHAKRLELAEQRGSGKVTEAQYEVAVAQTRADISSQLQARMNNAAVANAAQRQALAAQQQAAAQGAMVGAAIMTGGLSTPSPAPRTTSCQKLGNTVHCNHY